MSETDAPDDAPARGRARALAAGVRRRLHRRVPDEASVRFERQHERIAVLERELARVSPQLAALEERVAAHVADSEVTTSRLSDEAADPGETAALLREIRAEHSRVRARITAATRYEERLRQLEDAVAVLQQRS